MLNVSNLIRQVWNILHSKRSIGYLSFPCISYGSLYLSKFSCVFFGQNVRSMQESSPGHSWCFDQFCIWPWEYQMTLALTVVDDFDVWPSRSWLHSIGHSSNSICRCIILGDRTNIWRYIAKLHFPRFIFQWLWLPCQPLSGELYQGYLGLIFSHNWQCSCNAWPK